jgi:hypothetical protein
LVSRQVIQPKYHKHNFNYSPSLINVQMRTGLILSEGGGEGGVLKNLPNCFKERS